MAAVQSVLQNAILLLSVVTLTLCQDELRYWVCPDRNICYDGSHGFMYRYNATTFCENHNMTLGISSPMDYETLIKVPFATNYTWIGINRYKLDRWQFLSGVDFPSAITSNGSQGCVYQKTTEFLSDACYEKKKYVCHRERGIERNFTLHHTPLSWYDARNDCLIRGGDLYDANLYGYVVFNTSSYYEHFWVGITKDVWTWTATGKRVNLTYWSPSQPYGNGTCVSFNANGWYLSNCQDDTAQALCFTRKDTSTTFSPSSIQPSTTSTEPTTTTTQQSSTTTVTQSSSLSTTETQKTDENKFSVMPPPVSPSQTTENLPGKDMQPTDSTSMGIDSTSNASATNKGHVMANDDQGKRNKIIGGVIGGAVSLIVIVIVAVVLIRKRKTSEYKAPVISHYPEDDLPEAEAGPYNDIATDSSPPTNHYENGPSATKPQQQPQPRLNPYENVLSTDPPNPIYAEVARAASPATSEMPGSSQDLNTSRIELPSNYFADENPKPLNPSDVYAIPMKRKIAPN